MIGAAAHPTWLQAAILDLVSVDYLTNAYVDWSDFLMAHWGSSIFTMFLFYQNLIFHTPTDNFPRLALPMFLLVQHGVVSQ
jgi:hypothetical protein